MTGLQGDALKARTASANGVALLLVDVINAFDFHGSGPLIRAADAASHGIARLAGRARRRGVPVIYVNDNFGQWRSDFQAIVTACSAAERPGSASVLRLLPQQIDYFVLKPQHSGFYCTTLDPLLVHLKIHTIVVAGFAANLCVMFTANDAHMRGYRVVVPSDCTAANTAALTKKTLEHVVHALHGRVALGSQINFRQLAQAPKKTRVQPF